MAGESPDRSKQRESSAEPTSGTGGPVPDPRDPRLAVSRDPAEPNGTTDSATRILTVPPLDDPARLREAVATWVTPGDGAPDDTATDTDTEAADPEAADDSGERRGGERSGRTSGEEGEPGGSGRGADGDIAGSGQGEDGGTGGSGRAGHSGLSGSGAAGDGDAGVGGSGQTVTGGGGAGDSGLGEDGSGPAATGSSRTGRSSQGENGSGPAATGSSGTGRSSQGENGSGPATGGGGDAGRSSPGAGESGPEVAGDQSASGSSEGEGRGTDGSGNAVGAGSASGSAQVSEAAGTAREDVGGATQVLRTAGTANRFDRAPGTIATPADTTGTPGSAGAPEKAADATGGSGAPRAPRTASAGAQEAPEGALGAPEGASTEVKTPETPDDEKPAGETTAPASVRETRAAAAERDAEPGADGDTGSEAGRRDAPGAEPVRDATPGAGKPTGTASGPAPQAEAGRRDAPGTEPARDATPEAGKPTGTAPEPDVEAEAGRRATPEPEPVRDGKPAGPAPEPTTEAEAAHRTTPGTEPVRDTTPGAGKPAGATSKPTTDAPAPADGDRPPQGPPAPVDETRTGGAGGNTARAEGEAEARAATRDGGEAEHRTGRVDHPTTTLKLPPESEAERTSRFIALKPLDAPPRAERTTALPRVEPDRTTQQPLPPRPPLDLLAELTNTPPPAATPLRTVVRRVKIWTPLVLLLLVVFAIVQTVRPLPAPSLELTAQDSHTFEGEKADIPWPADGQAALDVQGIGSFGSSGEQEPMPIASVAKVMTAYVILRDHPLKSGEEGPMIDIDQRAEDESDAGQESTVDVTAGDQISEREAVESILIASANNVARLLARWDATSDQAFVDKMNAAAADLGMTDTTYTDPSGLNDTTVSTAVDQVKLAKAAMEQPAFREVAAMMSYDDYKGVNHSNWNQLVGYNDVVGIKTGTTTSALGNLVFAATKDIGGETRTIVGAVVRQPAGGSDNTILQGALSAGDQLMRAAQAALTAETILKKGDVVGYVDDGLGGRTPVVVTRDVTAVGWAGLEVKVSFAPKELPRTAKAGTEVGSLTVGDGSGGAVAVPVALQRDLVEPGWADRLTRIG
ncbi:D-alanyl-D-alanine carboxypeptidase [Streptomyces sp. NPDC056716]|uniref:D-alanyl-D-alanine carboxypeptidase n=1 Tax=unclassified Streptomyces TaxID=2593676 RepID=UPI00367F4863